MTRTIVWFICGLTLANLPAVAQESATETVLYNFAPASPKGAGSKSGLIGDPAGNLYGTTEAGGTWNWGVVYKLDAGGETVLYSFTGGADGAIPYAGLARDAEGNLYGTTYYGGLNAGGGVNAHVGLGVVFKLDTSGHETVLHTFMGVEDGQYPAAGVTMDASGNLYGTTYAGGTSNLGVIYKVDATGQESVLYTFTGQGGASPVSGLILDNSGNLYGTAQYGGATGNGVVFKLSPAGQETVLYSFTGLADGGVPEAGLIRDAEGNLYGTDSQGAVGNCGFGCGVLFKLDPAGRLTVLYSFTGGTAGGKPSSGVIRDAAGNLYGTTIGTDGSGGVYMVDTAGQETVLYIPPDGSSYNQSGELLYADGNFYGTTAGGYENGGMIYKVDAAGIGAAVYNFPLEANGYYPLSGVTRDNSGDLYGTTYDGGSASWGVVYKLDAAGRDTVLYNFTGGTDGGAPAAGVILDAAGNLYGTTEYGGFPPGNCSQEVGCGVVYKVDTAGQESVLYSFTGAADGGNPEGGLIFDPAGNLYGTTYYGGSGPPLGYGSGVVFKVDATGRETVLHSFSGPDGANPTGTLALDGAGNLYGTTVLGGVNGDDRGAGVVYKVDTAGHAAVLYSFTGWADGGNPYGGVVLDEAGNVYGTTTQGGAANAGVVFKVDAQGRETVLYSFTGEADGAKPYCGLIRDAVGNLYGTTSGGGAANAGVVFQVDAAGQETVLFSFSGTDGANPSTGVIANNAGELFGTTPNGGDKSGGVVFRVGIENTAQ